MVSLGTIDTVPYTVPIITWYVGGQMCRNPSTKKTSERIMIVVGSDARKVVMEEFSWWHVKGASIRFNRLEICR